MTTNTTEIVAGGGSMFLTPSTAGDEARFTCWEGYRATDLDLTREAGTQLRDALTAWLDPTPATAATSPAPQADAGGVQPPATTPPAARDLPDPALDAAVGALVNVSNLPKWMQVVALGRDVRPIAQLAVDAARAVILAEARQRETRLRVEAHNVMDLLAVRGPGVVGHLLDTDDNPGQRLRDAINASRAANGLTTIDWMTP